MRGVLLALVAAVGLVLAWSQAAWSDPVDSSGRKYRSDRATYSERTSERRRYQRERRRASAAYRSGARYSRRHRYDEVRYSRRRYADSARYSRRRYYEEGPRYSRRHYEGPRYSRVGQPLVYYSRPATMRVLINPDAEVPGAYGWRDQNQRIGPFVTPRAIEMFFQRSQDRASGG